MSLDLKELADELDDLRGRYESDDPGEAGLDEDECERLDMLKALEDELGDLHIASRNKGPFIADGREWEEYARETAIDCDMISRDSPMFDYIDWEKWANDMQHDYTPVEFDGETYYYSN